MMVTAPSGASSLPLNCTYLPMRNSDGRSAKRGITNEPECLRSAHISRIRFTVKNTMNRSPKIVMNHASAGLTNMDR